MMRHEEASELLAVFALDAVDEAEHEQIEAHLAECPRCQAELDAHRQVAAALGNSVEPLPEGLWSSIAGALPPRPDEEPPPMPVLVRDLAEDDAPATVSTPVTPVTPVTPGTPFRTPGRSGARARRSSRGRLFSVAGRSTESPSLRSARPAVVRGLSAVASSRWRPSRWPAPPLRSS